MPKSKEKLLDEAQKLNVDTEGLSYNELRTAVADARDGDSDDSKAVEDFDTDSQGGPNRVHVDRDTKIEDYINQDTNAQEWSDEDVEKLEKELSVEKENIAARVIQSVRNYVKIKFFKNNKPLGTFKSRNFKKGQAKAFRDKANKDFGG